VRNSNNNNNNNNNNKLIETEELEMQCGIFQGDSLSALLFCVCLIPLTEQLNRLNTGYEEHTTKTKISHLLYMDDLKLLGKSEEGLQKQIQTVTTFSDDIHMEFGLDRCAKVVFKNGKLVHSQNLVVGINREIQELEEGKTYKFLGTEESDGIQHQQMKERLKKEYSSRLRMILKPELNAKNKITAIGTLAIPVLRYNFGIINWRLEEIKNIDRKTRKIQTMYKMHHPKADIDRLYVEGKGGGRGVSQIEAAYKTEIINIAEHLNKRYKEDQFVYIIRSCDSCQPRMNSTVRTAAKIADELSQSNEKNGMKQDGIQNTKARLAESLKEKWENKVMHGQYNRSIDKQLISEEDTFLWLSKGDLKAETESEIVVAQDQTLQTKYHATKILQTEKYSKCRLCHQFEVTVDSIVSACPILAKEQYNKRHDKSACSTTLQHMYGTGGKIRR
jgi:hypothetical protein